MYLRGPARRYLLPEARGAEMPDHGQLQVDEQGDGYQLRATDMVERLPYKEDVSVTRLRCQDGALCREGQHAVGDQHALRPSRRARRLAARKQIFRIQRRGIEQSPLARQAMNVDSGLLIPEYGRPSWR